jgi:hypothetical protein
MDEELDSGWYTISRFQPDPVDIDRLLLLLKHDDWQVRFNAARAFRLEPDARALKDLLKMLKREKHGAVRHMVALALGALHESGVDVLPFAGVNDPTVETRRDLAIKRLKELKVRVSTHDEAYIMLMIPHKLIAECFIEIGYLMAQLAADTFPEDFAPIAESVPSSVLPVWSKSAIEYVDSTPHEMKFRIYQMTDDR